MFTWIDKKQVLKIGKKYYRAGDEVPADGLTDNRIELFKSLKMIKETDEPESGPKKKTRKPRKKKEKLDDTGVTEESSGPIMSKPEDTDYDDSTEG